MPFRDKLPVANGPNTKVSNFWCTAQFESTAASQTVSAPTLRARFVDSSAFPLSARIPNIPQVLARSTFSPVGREVLRGGADNPWVGVEPHVSTYQFSGFSS
jgi:hypothetical protein